jgi:glycosyltransferase involved in cell wall biosynthesis
MKVSIIVTVYNREKFIARCLRSCLDQSMNKNDYEIIVVNDGSTDNSEQVINSFGNQIRKISYKKNKGLAYASNTGIEASNSKYVVRIDSDDYVHTDLLKIEYDFIEMNNCDAVSCDYLIVDLKEKIISRENAVKNPIACGIMFHKDRLIEIGLYDTKFRLMEDIDLRARFEKKFKIYNIEIPLYRYLMHESNATKNIKNVDHYTKLFKKKHEKK